MSEVPGNTIPPAAADQISPPSDKISTPPPSSSKKLPSLKVLKTWAPFYLRKSDVTISHLSRILSTPSGKDTLLLTLCYTSLLTSSILSSISLARIHRLALSTIEKAISLPPNTVVIIDTHNSRIATSRLLVTAQRLKALSSLISDVRIFARLFGLLGIWAWGKSVLEAPPQDVVEKRIVQLQVLVNICFQTLENGAYLASKGVLNWTPDKQNKAWLWSCRFWAAHVGFEFLRLAREFAIRGESRTAEEKRTDGGHGDVSTGSREKEWLGQWGRNLVMNAAWAPLTLHWSLEKGLLSDFGVGAMGTIVAAIRMPILWKETRLV